VVIGGSLCGSFGEREAGFAAVYTSFPGVVEPSVALHSLDARSRDAAVKTKPARDDRAG
jgi:hypothetical protein